MRFAAATVLSVLAASGAVSASSLEARQSPFPTCAQSCLANANLGGCVATDTACTCKNTEFVNSVTQCFFASCQGSDLTKAVSTAQALCRAVGITLTSTPVITGTGSAYGASATGNSSVTATHSGSSTGSATAAGTSSTTKANAAPSNSYSLTLAGASFSLGVIALSLL
ncbi:hypothetical protein AX15_007052 [Amanita polypyramis BW_CC]|nr:hypothetical protein AX15_007052 [Amanita polypyramis BW_CC]